MIDFFNQLMSGMGGVSPLGAGMGTVAGPQLAIGEAVSKAIVDALIPKPTDYTGLGGLTQQPFATGGFADFGADFGGVLDLLSQKISNLSGFTTNLKISSTTTTNLIVDGRILAEVVKPYLYSDMIRFEDSATSVSRNIVV